MNLKSKEISIVESISFNSWPAQNFFLLDGWGIRFGDGYTKRNNCVSPIYPSYSDIKPKVEYCEDLYHDFELPSIFRIPMSDENNELDQFLDRREYFIKDESHVLIKDLQEQNILNEDLNNSEFLISSEFSERWFSDYTGMTEYTDEIKIKLKHQYLRIILPCWFYSLKGSDGRVVATGVGVSQYNYFGLYSIFVEPTMRSLGIGTRLINSMLIHAKSNGNTTAYLNVLSENSAAIKIYQKNGFKVAYDYHYRIES